MIQQNGIVGFVTISFKCILHMNCNLKLEMTIFVMQWVIATHLTLNILRILLTNRQSTLGLLTCKTHLILLPHKKGIMSTTFGGASYSHVVGRPNGGK